MPAPDNSCRLIRSADLPPTEKHAQPLWKGCGKRLELCLIGSISIKDAHTCAPLRDRLCAPLLPTAICRRSRRDVAGVYNDDYARNGMLRLIESSIAAIERQLVLVAPGPASRING